jgi:hypothetical protein
MLKNMNSKKLIERADLEALLKLLLETDSFRPDSIIDSERPDFIITVPDRTIGVETTRSEPEEYFRALSIQASKYPSHWINITHFKNRLSPRTNKELLNSMGYNALLQPWESVEAGMLQWKQEIAVTLNTKREKLNQTGYQIFDENWLLIHNYHPLCNDKLTQERAGQLLNDLFFEVSGVTRDFDAIFVHSGAFLFRWQMGELCLI